LKKNKEKRFSTEGIPLAVSKTLVRQPMSDTANYHLREDNYLAQDRSFVG
jgi:hypothetical protein